MNKEIKNLVKTLKRKGWKVERGGKHFKARHPTTNKFVVFSGTPSCDYATKHILGDIKRLEKEHEAIK